MDELRTFFRTRNGIAGPVRAFRSGHAPERLGLLGGIALLASLCAGSPYAADLVWDCETTSGYQTCSGTFDEQKFTRNGTTLETWPSETSTLLLPAAKDSSTAITVTGSRSLDTLLVRGSGYTLSGTGSLVLATSPTVFRTDSGIVVSAPLGGTQDLEKTGAGTLTLAGSQPTWPGRMKILAGTLKLGSDSALGDTAKGTLVASGAVLDLDGHTARMEDVELFGGSLQNSGSAQSNAVQRLRVTASSSIGGAANWDIRPGKHPSPIFSVASGATLSKIGAGSVAFAGLPLKLDGQIVVRQGRLLRNAGSTFSGSGGITIDSSAAFRFTADSNRAVIPYTITMRAGYLEEFNANGISEVSGDLQSVGPYRNTINSIYNLVISGKLTGSGLVSKWSGGRLTLANDNPYTGILAIEGGILQIGNSGSTGSIVADSVRNNAKLVFRHLGTKTVPSGITGSGSIVVDGTGTDIFTAHVGSTGGTTILNGTMQIGAGGSTGSIAGNIADSATLVIDRSGTFRYADTLRGSGTLVKRGSGTLVLSGVTALRGGIRVEAGTLQCDGTGDSAAVEVGAGATTLGRGHVGLLVVNSGTAGAGTVDSIGLLDATGLNLSNGIGSTLRIRATGSTKPGVQYDRIRVAGNTVLDGDAKLLLDLTGFAGAGTLTGIVQSGTLSGKFPHFEVVGGHRWITTLKYTSSAVNVEVVAVPWVEQIDTTLPAGPDSVVLPLRPGLVVVAPPVARTRPIVVTFDDSTLGRGISGADSALIVGPGSTADGPLLLRMPTTLIPAAARIAGETPSVFRIDASGHLVRLPILSSTGGTIAFSAVEDGAYWIGYDTLAPSVALDVDLDSIRLGDSATLSWSLRDNVTDASISLCLRRPGDAAPVCSSLGKGDSLAGRVVLDSSDVPRGCIATLQGMDSRSTRTTSDRDIVVQLDSLRSTASRLEDRYELVSLPYARSDTGSFDLFRRQWGTPDRRKWRVFDHDTTGYFEILAGDSISPLGHSFWVRTRGVDLRPWIADAWTLPLSKPVTVELAPGWNMVGNPYGYDLDRAAIVSASGLDTLPVAGPYLFDGAKESWIVPDSIANIPAWRGFAIHNASDSSIPLRMPTFSGTAGGAPRAAASEPSPLRIDLTLTQSDDLGTPLQLGIVPATASPSSRRLPLPPTPLSGAVAWIQPEGASSPLLRSFAAPSDSDISWTVRIDGLTPGRPLMLRTARSGSDSTIPVSVFDAKSNRWLPLEGSMDFTVASETSRVFGFLAGPSIHRPLPASLELSLRGRILSWNLPASMGPRHVRIELRDLSGRLLSTPLDESMDPGSYHKVLAPPTASRPTLVVLRVDHELRTLLLPTLR